jgi:hypothetical protein
MNPLLDSLIAQWRRCGGTRGDCRTRNCARCARGLDLRAREDARG